MTTLACKTRATCAAICGGQGPRSLVAAWVKRLAYAERARSELNGMTDVELKDVGLTRGDIGTVVNGTFSR